MIILSSRTTPTATRSPERASTRGDAAAAAAAIATAAPSAASAAKSRRACRCFTAENQSRPLRCRQCSKHDECILSFDGMQARVGARDAEYPAAHHFDDFADCADAGDEIYDFSFGTGELDDVARRAG